MNGLSAHFITVTWQLTNTLDLVLLGFVLPATLFTWLAATRRRTAGSIQPPGVFHRRQDPEQSDFNLKPVPPEISKAKEREPAAPSGAGRHILFVDDERRFAEDARITLKELGDHVTLVADAHEALAVIHGAHEPIDCVITDLSMPGMSGFDLARLCQRLLPGVPVILMSHQDNPIAAELLQACGIPGALPKPFTRQSLVEAVRRVLTAGKDLD